MVVAAQTTAPAISTTWHFVSDLTSGNVSLAISAMCADSRRQTWRNMRDNMRQTWRIARKCAESWGFFMFPQHGVKDLCFFFPLGRERNHLDLQMLAHPFVNQLMQVLSVWNEINKHRSQNRRVESHPCLVPDVQWTDGVFERFDTQRLVEPYMASQWDIQEWVGFGVESGGLMIFETAEIVLTYLLPSRSPKLLRKLSKAAKQG